MAEKNKTSWDLSAYMDGELGQAEADRIARALRDDRALQQELETLRATREMLLRLPRHRAGKALTNRIMAAAEQLQARGKGNDAVSGGAERWLRRLATAAVLLVATGAGMMVTRAWLGQNDSPTGTHIVRTDVPEGGPGGGVDAGPSLRARRKDEVSDGYKSDSAPGAGNEVIFTHDLDLARRDVERALLTNGLVPEARGKSARIGKGRMSRAGGSNFRFSRPSIETLSCEVVGTPEQIAGLRTELGRIRKSQFVVQAPRAVVDAPGGKLPVVKGKKTELTTGVHIVARGGATPGPRAATMPRGVLPKAVAPTRDGKQAPVQIDMARAEGLVVKGWDRLLDMVWGGQASQEPRVLAAEQAAGKPAAGADAWDGRQHVPGTLQDVTARQQHEALARQQKGAGRGHGLVTANVRQLTITLNRSPLTREAAAREAAMKHAADSAKE